MGGPVILVRVIRCRSEERGLCKVEALKDEIIVDDGEGEPNRRPGLTA